MNTTTNMPWAVAFQLIAPYGVELIQMGLTLFAKELSGTPVTPEDWRGLAKVHAAKVAEQDLAEAIARDAQKPPVPPVG